MSVDLRLLRYFVTVAETLHFGRAADRLFVSQPALSQQIRKLETDLRTTLFVRDRRTVDLTDAGHALLPHARAALEAGDAFVLAARRQARMEHREFVVGFHTRWPDNFLPRVLRAYREVRPDVSVDLRQFDFSDTSAGLRDGSSDVALLHLPLSPDGLRWRELSYDGRVVMLAEDHPLATEREVTVAQIVASGTPWGIPPDADPTWRDFWSAAAEREAAGMPPVTGIHQITQEGLFQTVASGHAVALTYAAMERAYSPPGISFVPVGDLSPAVLAVAWRAEDGRGDVEAFVGVAASVAGAPTPPPPPPRR